MPTLISETDVRLERADLLRRVVLPRSVSDSGFIVPPARTPGLHLSGLLRYIATKSKITTYLDQISEEEMPLRWMLGQAFEEFAVSLFPNVIWQPGECEDPVIMTCDGLSVESFGLLIHEFKFNRAKKYSGVDLLKKKWLWVQQCLGYALGYGAEHAVWNVLSAFEFPDPVWTQYLVRFDEKELRDAEKMLYRNKERAIGEGYAE